MHSHFPFVTNPGIDLTNPALPMIFIIVFVNPECVNVYNGKCTIFFVGDYYFFDFSYIMDKSVSVEKVLPSFAPSFFVISAQRHNPVNRIMGLNGSRPGPNHIRVKNRIKQVCVLCIPGSGFTVYDLGDFDFLFSHDAIFGIEGSRQAENFPLSVLFPVFIFKFIKGINVPF